MAEKTAKTTKTAEKVVETTKTAEKTAKTTKTAEKVVAPKVEIIRGRMPLPIVHTIKFGTEGETDGSVATKFRTTNGKVSDVRKNRNFAYVGEGMTFSQTMIDGAVAYAEQLDDKSIVETIKAIKVDDKADATIKEARAAARPAKAKAEGEPTKDAKAPAKKVSNKELDELSA